MTAYTAIADGEIDTDSPITESLLTRFRNNPIAITEGSTGAPKIQTAAYQAASVDQAAMAVGYPAAQTLTNVTNALYTFAHGRAARPWRLDLWLECISADGGYSIGDFIAAPNGTAQDIGPSPTGYVIYADATNVYLRISAGSFTLVGKSGGVFQVAASKWNAHIYAWGA